MAIESDVHDPMELVADVAAGIAVNDHPNEQALDLGLRLKMVRERNGLSQRELAKRAGITNSNISMIEQGLVSPSVNSLARVLSGIPMTLAQFFTCDPMDVGTVIYNAATLAQQQTLSATGVTKQTIAAEKSQRKLTLSREIYPAGCDTGAEPLRSPSETAAILVSGELEFTVGMQVHQLHAGDGFYLMPQQPYRIRNRSPQDAVVVVTALNGLGGIL